MPCMASEGLSVPGEVMTKNFRATSVALAVVFMLSACGGGNSGAALEAESGEDAGSLQIEQPPTSDDVPAPSSNGVPEAAAEREPPQATTCPSPTFGAPRVAAWDMSRDTSSGRQALLA